MIIKRLSIALILTLTLVLANVYTQDATTTPQPQIGTRGFAPVTQYDLEILNTYPHDSSAFTQGLLIEDGTFYESTGIRNRSTLRQVEIETGEIIRSIDVTRTEAELETQLNYFAEGLEHVDDRLIQLTWTANLALVYDVETFEQTGTIAYEGEGWGLCYDDRYLYMSDSSEYIGIREPDTFDLIGRMLITFNGSPVEARRLNELECVGDYIYANYWQTNFILQIDKFNGNVVGLIDAEPLLTDDLLRAIPNSTIDETTGQVTPPSNAVLNGIAYHPERDSFFITGKLWPSMFEVRFVPIVDAP